MSDTRALPSDEKFYCPHCGSGEFAGTVTAYVTVSIHKGSFDHKLWEAENEPSWNEKVTGLRCAKCDAKLTTDKLLDEETIRLNKKEW